MNYNLYQNKNNKKYKIILIKQFKINKNKNKLIINKKCQKK